MFKRSCFLPGLVLWLLAAGCTKEFDLGLGNTPPLVVIEGRISNLEGPYYVRVTRSTNQLAPGEPGKYRDSAEAVTGALVIISDDAGNNDTLIPANPDNVSRYLYSYPNGHLDSIRTRFTTEVYTAERGYYQTTKIKGVAGRTYHLQVQTGDSVFYASSYMAPVTMIDSVAAKETMVTPGGGMGLVPYVWFKEPVNEKNYYLLQYNELLFFRYDIARGEWLPSSYFPYYVVDDALLPPYVSGLGIRIIHSGHDPYENNYPTIIFPGSTFQVRLSSLTKEAYEYFKVLGSQFENDGNVYKPVPASAAGNISGGALGLFYATHVSDKVVVP